MPAPARRLDAVLGRPERPRPFSSRWTFDARDAIRARVLHVGFAAPGALVTLDFVPSFVRRGGGEVRRRTIVAVPR
jgi:hypothetical protein